MPKIRRRGMSRVEQLSRSRREALLYGHPILNTVPPDTFTGLCEWVETAEAKAAWLRFRKELLEQWFDRPRAELPWGSKRFDAPAVQRALERRLVQPDTGGHGVR